MNMFFIQCVHQHNKITGVNEKVSLINDIQLAAVMPSMISIGLFIVLSLGYLVYSAATEK